MVFFMKVVFAGGLVMYMNEALYYVFFQKSDLNSKGVGGLS